MAEQKQSGITDLIPYPRGILKTLVRLPMLLHQIGLGWLLRPFRLMALTTRGRNSGLARHAILEYRRHGSKVYVVSGWGDQPHWVKNALANPDVTLQFGQKEISAKATLVTDPAEALRVLYMFQRTGPIYETIIANMSNADSIDLRRLKLVASEFTVVKFEPNSAKPPLRGVQPVNSALPLLLLLPSLFIIGWSAWMIWSYFNDGSQSKSLDATLSGLVEDIDESLS